MPTPRLTLAACVALAGLAAACTDTTPLRSTDAHAGGPSRNVIPALQGPIANPFGVAVGVLGDATTLQRNASLLQDAGVGWIRLDFSWDIIQGGGPNTWAFGWHDAQVAEAQRRGLKVLATLAYTPGWASGDPTTNKKSPLNPADWERFVQTTVNRYSAAYPGVVTHWSVWNEPNDPGFWKGSVDQYITLVNRAAPLIRAAGGKVVAPELTAPGVTSFDGLRDDQFLARVLDAEGPNIDVVSVHGYSSDVTGPQGLAQMVYDRTVLTPLSRYAWRWPVWLTEVGVNECYTADVVRVNGSTYPVCNGTSIRDDVQAIHLQQVMDAMASAATPWWEKTFYYPLVDEWQDRDDGTLLWMTDRGLLAGEREARRTGNASLVTPRQALLQYRTETQNRFGGPAIGYRAHSANNGWQPEVFNGRLTGMPEQTRSMSWAAHYLLGMQVRLANVPSGTGVRYRAHYRGQAAWNAYQADGATAGFGEMDGIEIGLTNPPAGLRVCYRALLSTGAWQGEVCDGATAGLPGTATLLALRIRLVQEPVTPPPSPCPSHPSAELCPAQP